MSRTRYTALLLCAVLLLCLLAGCKKQKLSSVEAFLLQEDVRAGLQEEIASLEKYGLTMEVYADGPTLVYDCTYDEPIEFADAEEKASFIFSLQEGCYESAPTYLVVLSELYDAVDAPYLSVRLIYRNADGSELCRYEYEY